MSRNLLVRTLVMLLTVLVIGAGTQAQPAAGVMRQRVEILAAPELAGRGAGTPEADAAVETLAAWMREAGLQPGFGQDWFQDFPLKGKGWNGQDLTGSRGRNLVGVLPGRGGLAGRYIVVGAHYDHLGRLAGVEPTAVPEPGQYYPGANDNASGQAVLFDLVARLAAGERPADCRSILFICFAAEEVGLQGSGYLVAHPPVPLDLVDAMINFDTVGQMTDNRLYVSGVGTAVEFPNLVAAANTDGLDLSLARGGWSGSDHMSFNTREVPVLFLFGGPYMQYNTPQDTWDTLNYDGLAAIAAYAGRLVEALRVSREPFAWVMVAEKKLEVSEDSGQNRDTWLGTLPDFTEEIRGYKLAGVFDGSPAAKAGLVKGDVLILMAGQEVTDLPTFTRALRSNGPGDLVEITVLRDGKPLNFTVVLGDRKDRK